MLFFGLLIIAATAFNDLGDAPPYFDYVLMVMLVIWIVAGFFWVEGPKSVAFLRQWLKQRQPKKNRYSPNEKLIDAIISSIKFNNNSGVILVTFEPTDFRYRSNDPSHLISLVNHGLKGLIYRIEMSSMACEFISWSTLDGFDGLVNNIHKRRNRLLFEHVKGRLDVVIMRTVSDRVVRLRSAADIHLHISKENEVVIATPLKLRYRVSHTPLPFVFTS